MHVKNALFWRYIHFKIDYALHFVYFALAASLSFIHQNTSMPT